MTKRSGSSPAARSVGILRLAQHKPDRNARETKNVAQTVDQIARVGLGQILSVRAKDHKGGRPGVRLRHVTNLDAAPAWGRRRMALDHFLKPAVERGCGDAPVPERIGGDGR